MSTPTQPEPAAQPPDATLSPRDIGTEMRASFLDYSMSVIVSRALPDIRDGLKPVHRRILYAMHSEGLASNKKYSKCAGVVGEVLKKYHPHGDSSVYDAMVRMVQDFSLLHPMIDGQGNFGSVDGDPAAAYRYTECRLAKIAEEVLADIDQDTVDFLPNFDGTTVEPVVLPSRVPNLLVNGSSGIAVGMATNIPPHNLSEVCDAAIARHQRPQDRDQGAMKIMKGPDFPTGGIVRGKTGIKDYFETGRGSVRIQAVTEIEDIKGNRQAIIVTELPYQVNKATLLETIADLVREKKIPDISDIRDESDRKGMRMVIEIKRDGNANVVLNQLYKHTQMETSFGVILLSLVDGRPRILPVREMLGHYIQHRKTVIIRRTKFQLRKALDRAHILEGFLIALKNIDRVIKIIRGAKDTDEARAKLMTEFELSKAQTQAILDMRLHQLTRLSVDELQEEYDGLMKRIAELKAILADIKKVMAIVVKELEEVKAKFGKARQTQITTEAAEMTLEDLITKEEVLISLSSGGYIKRIPVDTYEAQGRGGKGIMGAEVKEEDFIEQIFITDTHATLLFFTTRGRVFALGPTRSRRATAPRAARPWSTSWPSPARRRSPPPSPSAPSRRRRARRPSWSCARAPGPSRRRRSPTSRTSGAPASSPSAWRRATSSSRPSTPAAKTRSSWAPRTAWPSASRSRTCAPWAAAPIGVKGIRLDKTDQVIGMEAFPPDSKKTLLTVCENGYGKRTDLSEYRGQHRGGGGVITIKATERNGIVTGVKLVTNDDDLMVMTEKGKTIRLRCKDIKVISRNTQGVRLVKLDEGDKVGHVAALALEPAVAPEPPWRSPRTES